MIFPRFLSWLGTYSGPHTFTQKAMVHIPSAEELLLEVHQSLGLPRDPRKNRFANLEMQLEHHRMMAREVLDSIFAALDMSEPARRDATMNFMEWTNFHQSVALRTWTANATQQQVFWHLLAYSYVPAFARRLAFWSLASSEYGLPAIDAGMPGGKFWFLPEWDQATDQVTLPVPQVIRWLHDLLGGSPKGKLAHKLGNKTSREDGGNDAVVRTLQYWLKGTTPKSAEKIAEMFPDDATLEFGGCIQLDETLTVDEQFQAARKFVLDKGLNATTLRDEIPMPINTLQNILNDTVPEEDRWRFIKLIGLRYARPEMQTIRQRLRVARMMQDGYQRALSFLCPGVEETCADPARNKLLQLTHLFHNIYNVTIQAWKNSDTESAQDAWFEDHLPPLDKEDLLLSILPSGRARADLRLADRLTWLFREVPPDGSLDDLVPWSSASAEPILLLLTHEQEEIQRLRYLVERVRTTSPWRALQAEESFRVVSQFSQTNDLPPKLREMAFQRLREVSKTPGQLVETALIQLTLPLIWEPIHRPKDIQQRVQGLLDEAEASEGYEEWKAPLLRLRAKHRLNQNDFERARSDFKAALEACAERGFGNLRGEIAREGWATEIAEVGFIPQNQELYYRNMLNYYEFPNGVPSLEDAATECENYFWTTLYQPYPGIERREGIAQSNVKTAVGTTFGLIFNADWHGLREWITLHAKAFRKTNLKDARRNTVLLSWLKMLHHFEGTLPDIRRMATPDVAGDLSKVEQHILNWREAIAILLAAWPEQARIADFKGQTPLMLVADNGDIYLTRLLAPMSDVNTQDVRGRTALHAAVSGRSSDCVAAVLERNPDVLAVTKDGGNTALHTAVQFGTPTSARLILEEFPGLAGQTNGAKQTPLAMAHLILKSWPEHREAMRKENRRTGSPEDFSAIIALLENHIYSMK